MQIFIVMAIGVILTVFGTNQYLKYSNSTSPEMIASNSLATAGNLLSYNDFAYRYLLSKYSIIINQTGTYVNNIYYKNSNDFNFNSISNYASNNSIFEPITKFGYSSTYFLYNPNTVDTGSVPILYLITTWNSTTVEATNMFRGLNQILGSNKNSGDSTYWVNAVFGEYSNINTYKIYSPIPPNDQSSVQMIAIILNQLSNQGFGLQKYFYLTPIYMSN